MDDEHQILEQSNLLHVTARKSEIIFYQFFNYRPLVLGGKVFSFFCWVLVRLQIHFLWSYFAIREKSKLREDIVARRQKKLFMRHDRHKYLEEAALREAELLQELDRCCFLSSCYIVVIAYSLVLQLTYGLNVPGREQLKLKRILRGRDCWKLSVQKRGSCDKTSRWRKKGKHR